MTAFDKIQLGLKKACKGTPMLTAALALALAGCGGGNTGAAGAGTVTGQFVDAQVAGLGYKCGTATALTGTTNATGQFTCNSGQAVAFYVGDILLGSVAAVQSKVTPLDLAGPGATPSHPTVVNIVRFLMSISSTAAASGTLTIDPSVVTAAKGKTIDFTSVIAADLDTVINAVKPAGATVASATEASNHMTSSLNALFAGSYSGSFSGSYSGTWSITIATDGSVSGTATDATGGVGTVSGNMATTMGTGSTFAFTGTGGGTPWVGILNLITRQFSGTWNDGAGSSGTFTGTASASIPVNPGATGSQGYPAAASFTGKLSDGSACTVDVAADHSVTVSAASWAYTGGAIKTTLDGYYFEHAKGEIAPAVFYNGTTRFYESNVGSYQAATTTTPAYNTGLNFDATSGQLIMAFGSVTTDPSFTPAAGANFSFVCAGSAYPASTSIGASTYNQAAPSRFKATTLVGGPYTAPSANNQTCTFSVDATGNASINWAGFTSTGGKLDLPSTWLTTAADQTTTQAKYDIYYNKTTGAVVGTNMGGTVVLNAGDNAISDWFSVTISQSGASKQATVMANGYIGDPKSVTCSTANDPAGKWAQVATHVGTWVGSKDLNFHFGTNASCQLVVDAAGAMTYTDTAGAATAIDSTAWTVTPPNSGAYFDFAKNGSSVTFGMDFTGTTVSGGQPQAFYWKSGGSYEYCNNMVKQ